MIETIISNNCTGGAVLHELGMEFKTPTINLQILPEQYPKFCERLDYYMSQELKEIHPEDFDQWQRIWLDKMFRCIPDMPFGILDDVLVCFQHYPTFAEAKTKWDERKGKIDYDRIGYIFHARGEEYRVEAEKFVAMELPNGLCLTQGFDVFGAVRFDGDGFETVNNKLRIVQIYDYKTWRDNG